MQTLCSFTIPCANLDFTQTIYHDVKDILLRLLFISDI